MSLVALTRPVPPSIVECELTHLDRAPIDVDRAIAQHAAYEVALQEAGCRIERIAAAPDLPDSVFVEDTAIVLDEIAIITRPGADSRRAEIASVARALAPYRQLASIVAPATIDGGDVLRVGHRIFVGVSTRTNEAAVVKLRDIVEPHGYSVTAVNVGGVLHLKSAVTQVGASTLLVNPALIDLAPFTDYELIEVDPAEPSAANALMIGDAVLFPSEYPRTRKRLEDAGIAVRTVEASEVAKAEGALTCCSLVFEEHPSRA